MEPRLGAIGGADGVLIRSERGGLEGRRDVDVEFGSVTGDCNLVRACRCRGIPRADARFVAIVDESSLFPCFNEARATEDRDG